MCVLDETAHTNIHSDYYNYHIMIMTRKPLCLQAVIDPMVSFIRGRKRLPGYRHFHPGGPMFSRFEISEIVLVSWKSEAGKYYMS